MDHNSDVSLWYYFQKGDMAAFSALFRRYYPLLNAYGLKICNDPNVTEDCLQEFFVYLHDKKDTLGTIKNLRPYLFVSFKRRLIKALEKQQRSTPYKESTHLAGSFYFSQQEIAANQENKVLSSQTLHTLLNGLSPRQKEVIYLKYYSGLNTTEISEIMKINYQSVLNILQKAIINLRNTSEKQLLTKILKKT